MNKIKKWLIHKLGGFTELPIYAPEIVEKTCNVKHVTSVIKFRFEELECIEHYRQLLFERITNELIRSGCVDIKQLYTQDGSIEFRAKVCVVKR